MLFPLLLNNMSTKHAAPLLLNNIQLPPVLPPTRSSQFSSVMFKMVPIFSEMPIWAPPCLSYIFKSIAFETSPMFVQKEQQKPLRKQQQQQKISNNLHKNLHVVFCPNKELL